MKNKVKRLAIIPARSGSIRIKNKNIKDFHNKPIIQYTLNNAIQSKLFTDIHVSTDSKKTTKLVEKLGLKVNFLRPKKPLYSSRFTPTTFKFSCSLNKDVKKGRVTKTMRKSLCCSRIDFKTGATSATSPKAEKR